MDRIANGRSVRRQSRISATRLQLTARAILLSLAALLLHTPVQAADLTSRPPKDWATDAATMELEVLRRSENYLRYRMHVVDQKGDQTRDVIESKDGTVARLILRDGRPLTADEDAAERNRLNDLLASPDRYAHHIKNDSEGKKLASELVRQMPDAMIYTYTPGQPHVGRDQGGGEVVLDYTPDPRWSPPSVTAQALTGLKGRLWIDGKTHHMLRMEGEIFKPVNFGWGMLAHIYPGGKLELEQTDAGGGRWIYTHFKQNVSVRALMVKTINVHTEIDASAFQALPGTLSLPEAIKMLLATPLPTH